MVAADLHTHGVVTFYLDTHGRQKATWAGQLSTYEFRLVNEGFQSTLSEDTVHSWWTAINGYTLNAMRQVQREWPAYIAKMVLE